MGALYKMVYAGQTGQGGGVIYIGADGVTGMDIGEGVYSGSVAITDRARGRVNLRYPQGGSLVTGQQVPAGATIPIDIDVPADFGNGMPVTVSIAGRQVNVRFTKISDIPIPAGAATGGFVLGGPSTPGSPLDGPGKLS